MKQSGAEIVKSYLEKYVLINQLKTKQHKYEDQSLARETLSIAYHLIHDMEECIRTNQSNDFEQIKLCIRYKLGMIHTELKSRQALFVRLFCKPKVPADLDACLQQAWAGIRHLERHYPD